MKTLPKILTRKEVEELSMEIFPTFSVARIEADRVCMRKGFIRGYILAQEKILKQLKEAEDE